MISVRLSPSPPVPVLLEQLTDAWRACVCIYVGRVSPGMPLGRAQPVWRAAEELCPFSQVMQVRETRAMM